MLDSELSVGIEGNCSGDVRSGRKRSYSPADFIRQQGRTRILNLFFYQLRVRRATRLRGIAWHCMTLSGIAWH